MAPAPTCKRQTNRLPACHCWLASLCAPGALWRAKSARDIGHEDQEFAAGAQGPPPRQPAGPAQGSHVRHQQDPEALQGPAGLRLSDPALTGSYARLRFGPVGRFLLFTLGAAALLCAAPARAEIDAAPDLLT